MKREARGRTRSAYSCSVILICFLKIAVASFVYASDAARWRSLEEGPLSLVLTCSARSLRPNAAPGAEPRLDRLGGSLDGRRLLLICALSRDMAGRR